MLTRSVNESIITFGKINHEISARDSYKKEFYKRMCKPFSYKEKVVTSRAQFDIFRIFIYNWKSARGSTHLNISRLKSQTTKIHGRETPIYRGNFARADNFNWVCSANAATFHLTFFSLTWKFIWNIICKRIFAHLAHLAHRAWP